MTRHGVRSAARLDRMSSAPFVPGPPGMSQRILLVLQASSAILSLLPAACGGGGSHATPSTYGAPSDGGPEQAAAGDAASDGAPTRVEPGAKSRDSGMSAPIPTDASTGFVRLAVWAPDAPAGGYDVCVMQHGGNGSWTGPLLGSGVAFPSVGRYVAVPPGNYDVGVVAPGSACASPVAAVTPLPAITANSRATVALVGDLTPNGNDQPAKVVVFADDVAGPRMQAAVRFIDALPGATAVIFGTGMEMNLTFSPLTGSVSFAGDSSSPADGGVVDSDGYLLLGAVSGVTLSAQVPPGDVAISSSTSTSFGDGGFLNGGGNPTVLTSGTNLASGTNASWASGSAVTVALVRGTGGSAAQFVLCQDDAAPQGTLSACSPLAP